MFGFCPKVRKKIEFSSNPPILETYQVVADERDGKVYNKVISVPCSNESVLSGLHFSRESMSLRAKLNMGLPMRVVGNPNISDFASAYKKAASLELQVESKLNDLRNSTLVNPVEKVNTSVESNS